jgi:hypothetical protein
VRGVETLPGIATKRARQLVKLFLYHTAQTEQRDAAGEKASLQQAMALALGVALRVLLDPANRERLIEESEKSVKR